MRTAVSPVPVPSSRMSLPRAIMATLSCNSSWPGISSSIVARKVSGSRSNRDTDADPTPDGTFHLTKLGLKDSAGLLPEDRDEPPPLPAGDPQAGGALAAHLPQSRLRLRSPTGRPARAACPERGRDREVANRLPRARGGSGGRDEDAVADRAHHHLRRARDRNATRRASRSSLAPCTPARAGHSQSQITERYIHAAQVLFPGAAAKSEDRMFQVSDSE